MMVKAPRKSVFIKNRLRNSFQTGETQVVENAKMYPADMSRYRVCVE